MKNAEYISDDESLYLYDNEGKPFRVFPGQMSNVPEKEAKLALSWSFIAGELSKGALSWMAGKILDSIFNRTPITPRDLINLMVREVEATLKSILVEQDLRLLIREYTALLMGMEEYGRSGGVHRLDNADLRANYLLTALGEYGTTTKDLYFAVIALKISVYQAYTVDNHRDETQNLISFSKNQFNIVSNYKLMIEKEIERMYSGPSFKIITVDRDGGYSVYGFEFKGNFIEVTMCWPYERDCIRRASSAVQAERERHIASTRREKLQSTESILNTLAELSSN